MKRTSLPPSAGTRAVAWPRNGELAIALPFLIDVLSPGPLKAIANRAVAGSPHLEAPLERVLAIYRPLDWLCDHVPLVAQFYEQYLELFY